MSKDFDPADEHPGYQRLLGALRHLAVPVLRDPAAAVRCVAIGRKSAEPFVPGEPIDDLCLTAFVDRKLSTRELGKRGVTPFDKAITRAVVPPSVKPFVEPTPEDLVLDVVECGSAFAPEPGLRVPASQRGVYGGQPPVLDAQRLFRTLRVGIGITNPAGYPDAASVGTIGFFVRDPKAKKARPFLVTNNHVIGRANDAKAGEPVVQPGTLDLTENEFELMPDMKSLLAKLQVARVAAVVPLSFTEEDFEIPVNYVDAALAELTAARPKTTELDRLAFGGVIRGVAAPYTIDPQGRLVGDPRVYKLGRTTGYTEGQVVGLAGTASIDYADDGSKQAFFQDQLVIKPTPENGGYFSDSGDSGSGILNARHELVGLLYAGSKLQTLANPITRVLDALRRVTKRPALEVITG